VVQIIDATLAANNFGDTREGGLAGPAGLFMVVAMAVILVLLIRNMNKRLRRLPDKFPTAAERAREAEAAKAADGVAKSEAAGPGAATSAVESPAGGTEVAKGEEAGPAAKGDGRSE
jgi:Na+-transporting methylmalonyl-CoA/oxaloacetate decarboxylase gamma subunit